MTPTEIILERMDRIADVLAHEPDYALKERYLELERLLNVLEESMVTA